jgi:hypothetical protein
MGVAITLGSQKSTTITTALFSEEECPTLLIQIHLTASALHILQNIGEYWTSLELKK